MLNDYPINTFGALLADVLTTRPEGSPGVRFIHSAYTSNDWNPDSTPINLEGSSLNKWRTSDFVCTIVHSNMHWYFLGYSFSKNSWLLLDSIPKPQSYYTSKIEHIRKAVEHFCVCHVPLGGNIIMPPTWPTQVNGIDCGVYACIGVAFVLANLGTGGLARRIIDGEEVKFPPLPLDYINSLGKICTACAP